MSKVVRQIGFDEGAFIAREKEDVVVAGEIIRHRLSSRIIHWSVANTFLVCLITGLPVWTPVFGWLGNLVGGLSVCRMIHPIAGLAFAVASLAMALQWWSDMRMTPEERGWVGPKLLEYLRDAANHDRIGKYNGGQKVYFYTTKLAALGLLVSGLVLWYPESFAAWVRVAAVILHDTTFILFAVSLVFHIYLATVAEPGTFNSMTRGTVSKAWARIHHPKWYRDLMGIGNKGA